MTDTYQVDGNKDDYNNGRGMSYSATTGGQAAPFMDSRKPDGTVPVKRADVVAGGRGHEDVPERDAPKPSAALVMQAVPRRSHRMVTLRSVTGTLVATSLFRFAVKPGAPSDVHQPSQVAVDKALTVIRHRISPVPARNMWR